MHFVPIPSAWPARVTSILRDLIHERLGLFYAPISSISSPIAWRRSWWRGASDRSWTTTTC